MKNKTKITIGMSSFIMILITYGISHGVPLFHDTFEYSASNNAQMVSNGLWQDYNNSNGNVSTAMDVNNGAASCKEGIRCGYWYMGAKDYGYQTDNHVSVSFSANQWGPDLWWQYWILIANQGSQRSCWTGSTYDMFWTKWFYMDTRSAGYNNTPVGLIGQEGYNANQNLWDSWVGSYPRLGNNANMFLAMQVADMQFWRNAYGTWDEVMYQNLTQDSYIPENRWVLVKQHLYFHSSQGRWEAWIDMQDGRGLVKVADWNNVNTGLAYQHNVQWKVGTTWPTNYMSVRSNGYIYIDDLYIATSESDLPGCASAERPSAPTDLRILSP